MTCLEGTGALSHVSLHCLPTRHARRTPPGDGRYDRRTLSGTPRPSLLDQVGLATLVAAVLSRVDLMYAQYDRGRKYVTAPDCLRISRRAQLAMGPRWAP